MRKRLAIVTLLFGFIGVAYSQVPQNGGGEKQPEHEPYQWRDLYAPANVPNWFLFGAALWAGIMALRTLKAIEKQTNLQTVAYTQWVKIENWEAASKRIAPAGGIPYGEIQIGFDVVNGSDFPLTMNSANFVFAGNTIFNSGDNVFLPPHSPYRIKLALQITTAQLNTWEQSILAIAIQGDIPHIGILGNPMSQSFKGLLVGGRDKAPYFQYEISMVPTEKRGGSGPTADR